MRYLKTNTATIVTVGPFFDKTDGVTIETGLTITNERITFVVDANDGSAPTLVLDNVTGATSGTSNDLNYITNNDAGLMQLELAAANVNYLGRAMLTITDAANHVPVFHEFMILPAVVYDALVAGTDYLTVDAVQVEGADATDQIRDAVVDDATRIDASALNTASVTSIPAILADTGTDGVVVAAASKTGYTLTATTGLGNQTANITGNLSGSVGSVTGAVGSVTGAVGSVTGNVGGNVAGSVASVTNAVTVGTNNDKTGYSLSAAGVQAIWDALTSALTTVGSVGKRIADNLDGTVSSRSSHSAADVWAAATRTLTSAADSAGVTTLLSRIVGTLAAGTHNAQSGDAYARLGAPAGASVSADVAAVKAQTAAIEADTQDLQTQVGVDGVGLTAIGDTRIANLDATVSSRLAAASYTAPLDAAGTRTAIGLATANLDTQLAGLPTDADVQAAATAALNAYDPPTNAEMEARTLAAASYATAAALDAVDNYVDTEIAAIKAKTDNLPASPAAVGSAMTLTAAYDAAKTAATQTSVDDLPTNAELAAALAAADDAMLAAIADVPTVAEFEARTLPAADYTVVSDLPSVPSAASIADAVWDEAIAGHAGAGSTGAALAAAGTAGDPWSTALPGAYGAGTAGKLLADLPTAAEVVAAMDADPPAVNVTYWAGVAATAGAIPAAVAGATGGIAIVGSEMGLADSAITSAKFASGAITAAAIAADAIGASELATDAVAEIWAYTTRTLTQSSTSTTDSTAAGSISRRRGDSWSISLTLGAITGYTSLWLTVKSDTTDADTASLLMVKKNASGLGDGLIYVNGAAASDAIKASITVSDATTGAIVIAVDESITDDLTPGAYSYDVQVLISGAVSTPDSGTFTVTADVTRAIA